MEESNKNQKWLLWSIVSIVYMLFISYSTSPLFISTGQDSSVFMIIGREILNGKVPYVDLFENKGPFLFFLEALPQLFSPGKFSIWVMQVIFISVSLFLIHDIACKLGGKFVYIFPMLYLAFLAPIFEGGNFSEEYSLFFGWICVWLFIKYINSGKDEISMCDSMLCGMCFICVTLIRINNLGPILGTIITLLLILFSKNEYKLFFKFLLSFLIGALVILIPVLWYYYHNCALNEMIYGFFTINFKYISPENQNGLTNRIIKLFSKYGLKTLLFTSVGIYGAIINYKINKKLFLWYLLISVFSFMSVFVSLSQYHHYLLNLAIPFIVGLITTTNKFCFGNIKMSKCLLIILLIICSLHICLCVIKKSPENENQYKKEIFELVNCIPEKDRSSIYTVEIKSDWYTLTGTLPAYKHFLPLTYMQIDPEIKKDFERYMLNTPPKWIILTENDPRIKVTLTNKVKQILKYEYISIYQNDIGHLYKKSIYEWK